MSIVQQVIDYLTKIFQWWVIVEPWEAGLRVRFGKKVRVLQAGTFFRIPFFDACYVQEIRMRMMSMNPQTVTTRDGKTITIVASIGYSISDVLKLFNTISHPDTTIGNIVLACIAQHVATHEISECSPVDIERVVQAKLGELEYGIRFEQVRITSYAIVSTYRLIGDYASINEGISLQIKR